MTRATLPRRRTAVIMPTRKPPVPKPAYTSPTGMQLYDAQGHRLYLTGSEREAFRKAAEQAPREVRTYCHTLLHTGCRPSEALALTADRVDFQAQAITFESKKKRSPGIYRAVPVPGGLLEALDLVYGIRDRKTRAHLWTVEPENRLYARDRSDGAGGHHRPPGQPQGLAAWLRRRLYRKADSAESRAALAWACAAFYHGDLCQCSRRGRARHCRKVMGMNAFLPWEEKRYSERMPRAMLIRRHMEEKDMLESLPLDQFVARQLASGKYPSYDALVEDALRLLQEREAEYDRIAEKLRPAAEQFRSGHPGVEFDVDDIVKRGMERLAAKNARQ